MNECVGSRAMSIWKKLSEWTLAAAIIGASPALSALPQPAFYSGSPAIAESYRTSRATTASGGLATTNLEGVRHEVTVAQRLLKMFGADFLPEFETYLATLDVLLSTEITSLSHAERLGSGLRMARVRFEEETSSVKVWARLASCIDMKPVNGRRVPRRFIKVRVREDEVPFGDEGSNLWARRTARDFASVDGDPPSTAI